MCVTVFLGSGDFVVVSSSFLIVVAGPRLPAKFEDSHLPPTTDGVNVLKRELVEEDPGLHHHQPDDVDGDDIDGNPVDLAKYKVS